MAYGKPSIVTFYYHETRETKDSCLRDLSSVCFSTIYSCQNKHGMQNKGMRTWYCDILGRMHKYTKYTYIITYLIQLA